MNQSEVKGNTEGGKWAYIEYAPTAEGLGIKKSVSNTISNMWLFKFSGHENETGCQCQIKNIWVEAALL